MEHRPNVALGVALGVLPLLSVVAAAGALVGFFGGPEGAARLFMEAGASAWAVVALTGFCALALLPLLLLTTRGRGAPALISLGVALLPWLAGTAGMRVEMSRAVDAITSVNPLDKNIILVAVLGETVSARLLGAWFSGALLGAVAIALGFAASQSRGENRTGWGVLLGAVPAALVAIAFRVTPFAGMAATVPLLLAAVAFTLAVASGSYFAGRGGGQLQVLPWTAAIAGALAFAAAASCAGSVSLRELFSAAAQVSPSDSMAILSSGIGRYSVVKAALAWGALVTLVACALAAGWYVARARPGNWAPGMALAALVLAGVGVLADAGGFTWVLHDAAEAGRPSWVAAAGVELPTSELGEPGVAPTLVLDDARLGPLGGGAPSPMREGSAVDVAADGRTGGAKLLPFLKTAEAAHVRALRFAVEPAAASQFRRVPAELSPLVQALTQSRAVEVSLLRALPQDAAEKDPVLFHAELTRGDVSVKPRAGTKYGTFPLSAPPVFKDGVVYLKVTSDTTVQQLVDAAARLNAAGFRPVAVTGDVPGHPEQALETSP